MKKFLTTLMIMVMVFASTNQVTALPLLKTHPHFYVERKESFKDLSNKHKTRINNSLKKCYKDGAAAALDINKLKNEKTEFEIGVREVLDKYYSADKNQRSELKDFSKKIDKSANQILKNYEEAEAQRQNSENLPFETTDVLVAFPYGTPEETIDTIMQNEASSYEIVNTGDFEIPEELPEYKKERLKVLEDYKTDIIVSADVTLEDTVERAIEKIEAYDCVKSAEYDAYYEADGTITTESGKVTANDKDFSETSQWNLQSINIAAAWNKFNKVNKFYPIWVAVIDSGFKMNHEDLKNMFLTEYSVDVTNKNKKLINCADAEGKDTQYAHWHGTRVAGVLAAQGNNNKGIAGTCSIASNSKYRNKIKIMGIKCDNTVNKDRHVTDEYLSNAITYAYKHGAEVINISYSTESLGGHHTAVRNAINAAIKAGVTVVGSVGNDGTKTVRYPAGFDGVIGVGAHLKNGSLAGYTNKSSAVDIVAPGGVQTGSGAKIRVTGVSGGYGWGGGTSYAAPQVAATVAMMKAINYSLTPKEILNNLKKGVTPKKIGGIDYYYLNAGKAVNSTKSY